MAEQTDATTERLDKELVARVPGQLGDQRNPYEDAPEMRFLNIAAWHTHENVHRGLFIDAEDPQGTLRYGWTNDQRTTWELEDVGASVQVEDVDLELPDGDETPEDDQAYVQEWLEIVVDELRYDVANEATSASIDDEIEFVGQRRLRLRDYDGREATFTLTLED